MAGIAVFIAGAMLVASFGATPKAKSEQRAELTAVAG
jgi:hypothetical protein